MSTSWSRKNELDVASGGMMWPSDIDYEDKLPQDFRTYEGPIVLTGMRDKDGKLVPADFLFYGTHLNNIVWIKAGYQTCKPGTEAQKIVLRTLLYTGLEDLQGFKCENDVNITYSGYTNRAFTSSTLQNKTIKENRQIITAYCFHRREEAGLIPLLSDRKNIVWQQLAPQKKPLFLDYNVKTKQGLIDRKNKSEMVLTQRPSPLFCSPRPEIEFDFSISQSPPAKRLRTINHRIIMDDEDIDLVSSTRGVVTASQIDRVIKPFLGPIPSPRDDTGTPERDTIIITDEPLQHQTHNADVDLQAQLDRMTTQRDMLKDNLTLTEARLVAANKKLIMQSRKSFSPSTMIANPINEIEPERESGSLKNKNNILEMKNRGIAEENRRLQQLITDQNTHIENLRNASTASAARIGALENQVKRMKAAVNRFLLDGDFFGDEEDELDKDLSGEFI